MAVLTIERCIYTYLDNGIHEFIFTDASEAAFDECLRTLLKIAELHAETGDTMRILIDSRLGMPPLAHAARRTQRRFDVYHHLSCRIAFLVEKDTMLTLAASFIGLITGDNSGAFASTTQRDVALSWLLAD